MGHTTLQIGLDDTDSVRGMCTTFLAYAMVGMLRDQGARFLDYPRLVRLNPNIPWKTRGNGAVALKVRTDDAPRLKEMALDMMESHADTANGANPGLVFLEGDDMPGEMSRFGSLALWRLIRRQDARRLVRRCGLESHHLGNGQGLVGAIAALGYRFGDNTMEMLSYRRGDRFGTRRDISAPSVRRMQEEVPSTFGSYDVRRDRVLITPGGPDPVFYGIRGEDPKSLLRASEMIKAGEPLAGYLLFRSNQGTGDHLQNRLDARNLRPYDSGVISGTVAAKPVTGRGGNVFLDVVSGGRNVCCAVYRETGIATTAGELIAGDGIQVGGGIRRAAPGRPRTLNVEFIRVLRLARGTVWTNPACPQCKKRMKSRGQNQGYRCQICKMRSPARVSRPVPRDIRRDLYIPVVGAHRHLTRPRQRLGRINNAAFDDELPWFVVYRK